MHNNNNGNGNGWYTTLKPRRGKSADRYFYESRLTGKQELRGAIGVETYR